MSCERAEELLSAYLEGDLGDEDQRLVGAHLETCPDCRSLLAALAETRAALRGVPELEVSASLRARLLAIPGQKKRFSFGFDFVLRPSLQPVFAAGAVLMTLVSFYFFGPYKSVIDRTVDRTIHQGYSQVERLFVKAGSLGDRLDDRKDNLIASLKGLEILGGSKDQTHN